METNTVHDLELAEGDDCPQKNCQGVMALADVRDCSCHLGHAPCAACVSTPLECDTCGFEYTPEE